MEKAREKKKQATRRKLIEAASIEFAEAGYARANISQISVRAGFAKGTVYNYFRSKYDLLLAVVEHAMEILTEQIRGQISDVDDPVEKIRRTIRLDYHFMEQNEALSKVILREGFASDPERQKEFLEALAPASGIFIEILEEGKQAGRIRGDLNSAWAAVLADGMVAYTLLARWAMGDAQLTYDEMADLTTRCFVEGILAK